MLYVVLVLVLVAAGLVVAALITANTLWAWISVGASVVAGIVMLAEWLRRRKRAAAAPAEADAAESDAAEGDAAKGDAAEPKADAKSDDAVEGEVAGELPLDDEKKEPAAATALLPVEGDSEKPAEDAAEAEPSAATGDPGEEDTDAADLLVVSSLDVEVLVVDEYPRYHLAECTWLTERDTIPIAVAEARDLGFTPCDRCGPDAHLAAAHRDSSTKASK
ncbi:hypothetical protein [Amycolatopsis sp. 195334CR]|uniref:hypothetical protein n=1 Tax=Amycolatopsis sp. 195334CR TaxID=2814588 RepID=UPI001A8FEE1E|nr:hypothetical protein [Amycolatopsis sp. 195334CR]MBN6041536.1 hypothetical protein [Amycolatopsis sp. 195334CR]